LPFHKFRQKLANNDVTKETLNCILPLYRGAADSIADAITCSFIGRIVL